jgi:lipoprotein-anchoring transpeptidase ErfK/SrfK
MEVRNSRLSVTSLDQSPISGFDRTMAVARSGNTESTQRDLARSLRFILLLLAAVVLAGCAGRQAKPVVATAPPIPTYGGHRRVVVSLAEQRLRAYDGQQLVFETRVSTGKHPKRTPTGSFRVLNKELMHYSTLYENSPMPHSVRIHGNYYLHGFSVVPEYPASHGCIRLPIREGNFLPAQQFYEWVKVGTPVRVTGS